MNNSAYTIKRVFPAKVQIENVPNIRFIEFILREKLDEVKRSIIGRNFSKIKAIKSENFHPKSKTITLYVEFECISDSRIACKLINSIKIQGHKLKATPIENTRIEVNLNDLSRYEKLQMLRWLDSNLNENNPDLKTN